jgi:hypothetical protein
MLAVGDEDPENDRTLVYALEASVGLPIDGLRIRMSGGFSERFVAESGDSPFRMSDSMIGTTFTHALLSKDRLKLTHGLSAWLPTSRTSLNRELRVAPTLSTRLSYRIFGTLSAIYQARHQYRWYRYAEVPNGFAMNTQWVLGHRIGLSLVPLDDAQVGQVRVSANAGLRWSRRYESRDQHRSDTADAALWAHGINWSASVTYLPLPWLALSSGFAHGSPLRRNGIVNPFLAHRDMTEVNFGLGFTY